MVGAVACVPVVVGETGKLEWAPVIRDVGCADVPLVIFQYVHKEAEVLNVYWKSRQRISNRGDELTSRVAEGRVWWVADLI